MLTDSLSKSSEIKARFDKLIQTFYQRFGEKKAIKIHEPRIEFYGFGHFYIEESEINSQFSEMGHTVTPKDKDIKMHPVSNEVTLYPMEINLNQIYLLNHGTVGMDIFFKIPPSSTNGGFAIDFNKLIETVAHEIAHALQGVKNVDIQRKSVYEPGKPVFTQCESSGERKGVNRDGDLLHPD
jgi:hypothetical protein